MSVVGALRDGAGEGDAAGTGGTSKATGASAAVLGSWDEEPDAVAAGAGVFVGTLFRNEQQAIGISLLLGLGLGALGGCMVPLEVFSPTMRQVAHITPQAWGNDAFAKLVGHGASIVGILPQLGILAAYAVVLLVLAAWRLRRVLSA